MKDTIFRTFSYLLGSALLLGMQHSFAEEAKLGGYEIQTKLRLINFDRDFEDDGEPSRCQNFSLALIQISGNPHSALEYY